MNVKDFEHISKLLYDRSGLVLGEDKAYLVESRLNPVARKWEFKNFDDMAFAIRTAGNSKLIADVVEAMTTNESFFFRDQTPFKLFEETVLPSLLQNRAQKRQIRIWSAACSSGQEPYTLAMLLKEHASQLAGWKVEILATDLSTQILQKAKEGNYSQFEVQRGLPITLMMKYFKQVGDKWQIADELRQMITYRVFNLLDNMSALGQFDVVYCRNVLIYFDQGTKTKVLNAIANVMAPDGALFLGGAETVLGISDRFQLTDGKRGLYGLTKASSNMVA